MNKNQTRDANTRVVELENQWKEEKNDLTSKLQELYLTLDRVKRDAATQVT